MARKNEPWFWTARNKWYVHLNGERVCLGEEKEAAWKKFYKLKSQEPSEQLITRKEDMTIAGLLDEVLDFVKQNRSQKTYDWYLMFYQSFLDWLGNRKESLAVEIRGADAQKWLNEQTWGASTKRGAATAIKRAFNYGVKHDLVEKNTMAGLEKPEAESREKLITQAQFDEILTLVPDENFRDVLQVVWFTGCRPQEVIAVEAKHHQKGCWMFERKSSKGKKVCRVVFLSDEAEEITKKWAERNPSGPIFRNTKGGFWTAYAFNCRFTNLQIAFGREKLKAKGVEVTDEEVKELMEAKKNGEYVIGRARKNGQQKKEWEIRGEARRKILSKRARGESDKLCMYAIRHSFAHQGITEGEVSPEVMAALLGHSDTSMIYRVYGHLLKNADFMREAAKKARK